MDQLVGVAREPVPGGLMDSFEEEFRERVAALERSDHFYWFKQQQAGNVEWPEMAEYPRALWAHATLAGQTAS